MFGFWRSASSADVVVVRREQHFDELLCDLPAELRADGPVQHDDASVRRQRIRAERLVVGLLDRAGDRDAARVAVLDDHAGRDGQLVHQHPRRREVGEVVERELAPVQLADAGEQVAARARLGVVRRALVRVLAVDEVGHLLEARDQALRERVPVEEPARDRGLVGGGDRERLRASARLVSSEICPDSRSSARIDP